MIRVEHDGGVTTITLNRPERLNACPPAMADEIFAAVRDIDDTRAILLTGEGDIPMAVKAMGEGAFGFLEKPCAPADLLAVVERALGPDSVPVAYPEFEAMRFQVTEAPAEADEADEESQA